MSRPPAPTDSAQGAAAGTAWYWHAQPVFLGGNEVRLLQGGDALFPAMEAAIAQARHEVWLATYIFHHDPRAERMAATLAAAAARGVRVRVVVDGFGSHASLARLQQWMVPQGVALAVFRPLERWWNWLQPGQLRRLHQKLCVVDGTVGFVGGINVIDDRVDLNHGPLDAPRLDFAVEVRGPAVLPIEQTSRAVWTRAAFGRDWQAEMLALARSAAPMSGVRRLLRSVRLMPPLPALPQRPDPVQVALVVRDNLRQRRAIERAYIEAIDGARWRVDLISPYFYPGQGFRRALRRAARRGVQVRLLLQGRPDYRLAATAARVLYDELLAQGVQIFEYTPAFLHAKVCIVDDDWATVGSSNIDPLSLLLNLEANLLVRDTAFAATTAAAFEQAVAMSQQVTDAPLGRGAFAALRRGLIASLAHWYLRMAGLSGRY
ncbi:cardiolipin synthase ClsB [Ideonella sp. 4Y11]|uniref:Cardiolipin synthase B n=1 Tax=Ideonella aquatica TaxID=2824119 RepID=A0A940YG71_9BURK|nr:cardiolipin synthase ClsB [Ideonella aquatica]